MRNSIRRAALGGIATLGVAALFAGCAPAPESGGTSGSPAADSDFLPCMVSDSGGFNDKSFNQLGFEGLTEAADALGVEPITVESASETDFAPNIDSLIDQGCTLIVTVGFLLSEATIAAAEANPDLEFAIIDDQLDADFDGTPDVDNGKPIIFDTAQAAFLAGYTAAAYSKTGTVGTYGGMQIPTVTIFMDGFADGVNYFNTQNGTAVKVAGWDVASQTGSFTGGFAAGVESKSAAQTLIDQGADVLMPVGGPIYQSAIEAIRDSGKPVAMIGVDADLTETDPDNADLFLTSVLKGIKVGVSDVVTAAGAGEFDNTPFVGTLENDGVGIAPFHDFESQVPADLQSQLDDVKAGIIDGSIPVESPSSPKQ
ncbi:BMP family lipoprotein [Compostimonas suwonensis]|uniref:Basic membrane protein A n=1 Tax=Compostimonas suwonensis TaxID=1048394 RepID=A0A2M9BV09_9MICO|nr:BMP family ABC transporter substrate-binding protein [Compostimonas suwonensis]PJJ61784.1 basic membrane protein A [Compostimonas suwonensis]